METKKKSEGKKSRGISAGIVIACCAVVAASVFLFIFGKPVNFLGITPEKLAEANLGFWENLSVAFWGKNTVLQAGHPAGLAGTIYKGGFVVVIVMTLLLTVMVLSVERAFAISKCKGKGNLLQLVFDVKKNLEKGDLKTAEALCAKQQGSVAAIISAGLKKYEEMETTTEKLSKEQKLLAIQKDIEEATALELPTMQQNLPVIATISTLGTLFGLLGTVLGMIRSFAAMSTAGAPDSVALAAGISEALINTAFGIATGALAIISYSFFTGKIDNMTYAIDEMGFSIVQTYASKHE